MKGGKSHLAQLGDWLLGFKGPAALLCLVPPQGSSQANPEGERQLAVSASDTIRTGGGVHVGHTYTQRTQMHRETEGRLARTKCLGEAC